MTGAVEEMDIDVERRRDVRVAEVRLTWATSRRGSHSCPLASRASRAAPSPAIRVPSGPCDTKGHGAGSCEADRSLSGDYVVEDQRPDGRLVLRPDLSVAAILAGHGERELTPEEFDRHFGHLPTDGEG